MDKEKARLAVEHVFRDMAGAMSAVFRAVLYRYAVGDARLGDFSPDEIGAAFRPAS